MPRISLTRWVTSCFGTPLRRSPKATLSNTFMCGNSAYDWNTMLTSRLCGGVLVTSLPCRRTVPVVGSSNPAIIRIVVVLPQPDGPSREKNSPSWMATSMPLTAVTTSPCDRNSLTTPRSSIAGMPMPGPLWLVVFVVLVRTSGTVCCSLIEVRLSHIDVTFASHSVDLGCLSNEIRLNHGDLACEAAPRVWVDAGCSCRGPKQGPRGGRLRVA